MSATAWAIFRYLLLVRFMDWGLFCFIRPANVDKKFSLYKNKYSVSPITIEFNQISNTIKIENNKKYENYFNHMSLQNTLDRVLELIGNLKIKESIDDEIKEELSKVKVSITADAFHTSEKTDFPCRIREESINLNVNSS